VWRTAAASRRPWPWAPTACCSGTRFLATDESPIAKGFKQAILDSDGHDTLVTDIP
jgi:hypothetical protein